VDGVVMVDWAGWLVDVFPKESLQQSEDAEAFSIVKKDSLFTSG